MGPHPGIYHHMGLMPITTTTTTTTILDYKCSDLVPINPRLKRYSLRTSTWCCGRVNNCCGATCCKNDFVIDILDQQVSLDGRRNSVGRSVGVDGWESVTKAINTVSYSHSYDSHTFLTACIELLHASSLSTQGNVVSTIQKTYAPTGNADACCRMAFEFR